MILTKNWPEVRYTHTTGNVLISAEALEARLRDTAGALKERQDTIDWIFACFPSVAEIPTMEQIRSMGRGGTIAREILARLKEEGLT